MFKINKMRWGENDTYIFVKLYFSHRCLWDVEDENHKSKFNREMAYSDIISKFRDLTNMELDQAYVKKKILSLRSTYSQELTKIRTRSSYKPSLKWFSMWHKLASGKGPLQPKDESVTYDDDVDNDTAEDEDVQKLYDFEASGDADDTNKDTFVSPDDDNEYIVLLKPEPDEESNTSRPKYRQTKRKHKHRRASSEISDQGKNVESYVANDDEFDIYGKYIASQLRGMSIQRALRVQLQIQRLMSEARLKHLSNVE